MPKKETKKEKLLREEWLVKYRTALNSDYTIVCSECGHILIGDSPEIHIVCLDCWPKINRE
jgi:hypothetical protein